MKLDLGDNATRVAILVALLAAGIHGDAILGLVGL